MSYFSCGRRHQADKYSSAKSVGQFSLAASLIVDDIKDMYDTITKGEDAVKYFWALVLTIGISLLVQLLAMIFAMILYFNKYPRVVEPQPGLEMAPPPIATVQQANDHDGSIPPTTSPPDSLGVSCAGSTDSLGVRYEGTSDLADPVPPANLKRLNDGLTILGLLVAVLHVIKNGLHSGIIGSML